MGLKIKAEKKRAMVLILILIIITSLSILIIGALKILTAVDTEYSINRNSNANASSKVLGKYICYKKPDGTLWYQKIEYNVDGSIKSFNKNTGAGSYCEFDVPKGARGFDVIAVAGGGAGSYSTASYSYNDLSSSDCIKENINEILKLINAKLKCTMTFSSSGVNCTSEYQYNRNEFTFDNFLRSITLKENNTGANNRCAESRGSIVLNPHENCNLSYNVNGVEVTKSLSQYSLYNKGQKEIEDNILANFIEKENFVQCIDKKPQYSICAGSEGSPGEAVSVTINGSIFGDRNASNKIRINASDIGSPGTAGNTPSLSTDGGDTVFKYWYRNSKGKMLQLNVTAKGGLKRNCVEKTIVSAEQIENIESKEGVFPEGFEIPSSFNFDNQLYAGYYSNSTPVHATFFGASGASGYINNLTRDKLSEACEYKEINGTIVGNKCCGASDSNKTACCANNQGTNGAPGAIIISW